MKSGIRIFVAIAIFAVSACSHTPRFGVNRAERSAEMTGAERTDLVREYYRSVLDDRVRISPDELRASLGPGVLVEPIGWTKSGRPFATVISGEWRSETRAIIAEPAPWVMLPHRSGRISVTIVTIVSTDLPDYFSYIGRSRTGFASILNDVVFLDRRSTEADSAAILAEALQHELTHIVDRNNLRRMAPEDLEIRAMVRALAHADLAATNIVRMRHALHFGESAYAAAARRIFDALSLVLGRPVGIDGEINAEEAEPVRRAARVLEKMLGLSFRWANEVAETPKNLIDEGNRKD